MLKCITEIEHDNVAKVDCGSIAHSHDIHAAIDAYSEGDHCVVDELMSD